MRLNDWGTNQLARELHIPASAISQALSLLELPAPIQDGRRRRTGCFGRLRLSKLEVPACQAEFADRVIAEGLTRDDTAAEVRRTRAGGGSRQTAGGGGRGATRKRTKWIFKHDGVRLIAEHSRGLDDDILIAVLEAALAHSWPRPRAGIAAVCLT